MRPTAWPGSSPKTEGPRRRSPTSPSTERGSEVHGVLVVDKPVGPTSHDIVDRVRAALGLRRAGHTGTLDPFATGVLLVCLGKATRLARFLTQDDKVYQATVRLGLGTTTDDLTGEPIGEPVAVRLDPERLRAAALALTGTIEQVPPAFSAKRVGGRRLYELARQGRAVSRPAVAVTVHALEIVGTDGNRVDLKVRCSSGTYVRALARDLGAALGVGGHLLALRRIQAGPFGLERAVPGDRLGPGDRDKLIRLGELLPDLPEVRVSASGRNALRYGRDLDRALVVSEFPEAPAPRWRVVDESGDLLALAVPRGFGPAGPGLPVAPVLHPDVVLVGD